MLRLVIALRLLALVVFAAGTGLVVLTLGRLDLTGAFSNTPSLPPIQPARAVTPVASAPAPRSAPPSEPRETQAPADAGQASAGRPTDSERDAAPPAVLTAAAETPPPVGTTAPVVPEPQPMRSGGGVDLNTASLVELNGLRGGGAIGRAIMRGRPYRSVEDLISRRILSRARFEQVKGQVSVRS